MINYNLLVMKQKTVSYDIAWAKTGAKTPHSDWIPRNLILEDYVGLTMYTV